MSKKTKARGQLATADEAVPFPLALSLLYVAVALTALEYFGRPEFFRRHFADAVELHNGLYPHLWWASWSICLYLVVPSIIVLGVFKRGLAEYGLNIHVKSKHVLVYLLMLAAVVPLVVVVSSRDDFRSIYPFFRGAFSATPGELAAWETAYLSQFIALEFFFRGFLVLGLGRYIGRASVWVAVIPYCMIHYHKPPLEAMAAIIAGLVLGEVARRTRSVLGGVIVHIGVAATMEVLAIGRWW